MARTLVPTTDVTRSGFLTSTQTTIAVANGAKFRNTGREWLRVSNSSGSTATITATIPKTVDGKAVSSYTWSLITGTAIHLPPFPADFYNNVDDMVYIDATQIVGMTCFRDGT